MNLEDFIRWCVAQQISLQLAGDGQLKVNAPPGLVTSAIRAELQERKSEIIQWLSNRQREQLQPYSDGNNVFPLSFAQQRLWLVDQIQQGSPEYNNPLPVRFTGQINVGLAEQALMLLIKRHDILRTGYRRGDEPEQFVRDSFVFQLSHCNLSELSPDIQEQRLSQLLRDEMNRSFNLADDLMLRATCIELSALADGRSHGVLLLNIHHIACDGWSLELLLREFCQIYQQLISGLVVTLPVLPFRYADYVLWQRRWLNEQELMQQTAYWSQQLADAPLTHGIPLDYPRPARMTHKAAVVRGGLPAKSAGLLRDVAKGQQVTAFMFCHAVLALMLSRHSFGQDVLLGTPIANRRLKELEPLVGFFANTLVLRTQHRQNTFTELLQHVRQINLDAQDHQDIPFDALVERLQVPRDAAITPLFQIMFSFTTEPTFQPNQQQRFQLPGVELSLVRDDARLAKFDLDIYINLNDDGLQFYWIYNTELFSAERVGQFNQHLSNLFTAVLANPAAALTDLPMLSEQEQQRLLEHYNPVQQSCLPDDDDGFIHSKFAQAAKLFPQRIALSFAEQTLTYAELAQHVELLAHYLQSKGVGPDVLVGVCLPKSAELIITILAILQAGGAYVPLEPDHPDDRIAYMLQDSQVRLLLVEQVLHTRLQSLTEAELLMVQLGNCCQELRSNAVVTTVMASQALTPDHLAYLIYTSGSTGQPKGVMQTHRNVRRLFSCTESLFDFSEQDTWLLFHSICFDFTVWELWGALFYGGHLVVPEPGLTRDTQQVIALCQQRKVTVLNQTPSAFKALSDALLTSAQNLLTLRYIIFGGEAFESSVVQNWHRRYPETLTRFVNMYGITETTVHATYWPVDPNQQGRSVIGQKLADMTFYLLDAQQQLVPEFAVGELYIGGAGLARGYLYRPALTAERFVTDPFSATPNARLYRTGDLVRYMADGQLEYMGRADEQVKIRGYRIELGEISAQLNQLAVISSNVVVTRATSDGTLQIVAYVVWVPDISTTSAELLEFVRQELQVRLPDYMMPAAIVPLPQLPMTVNGKIDRNALPAPDFMALQQQYVAPASELEQQLVQIWAKLLKVTADKLSVTANFFRAGGHSLLAVRLLAEIRYLLGYEIPVAAMFNHSSIRELADYIGERQRDADAIEIKAVPRVQAHHNLSAQQEQLWFVDRMQAGSPEYNINLSLELCGEFRPELAAAALTILVERHEILRTTYFEQDGVVQQRVNPGRCVALQQVDLSAEPNGQKDRLERLLAEHGVVCFNLAEDLMLRAVLYKLASEHAVLLLSVHHIACDGWSVALLVREFAALYQSQLSGLPAGLAAPTLHYVDYAQWSQSANAQQKHAHQLLYWQRQLCDLPQVHSLPTDKPRPAQQSYRGGKVSFKVDPAVIAGLTTLTLRQDVTLFMVIHAAFSLLLSRYSNEQDVVIGVPVANRQAPALQSMIGFFMNTLVLRTQCDGQLTFSQYLQQVKQVTLDALHHQDVPFQQVLKALDPVRTASHAPLFQVMLSMDNNERSAIELSDLAIRPYLAQQVTSKFDMILHVDQIEQQLNFAWEYNADIFEASTIEQMTTHFACLLAAVTEQPEQLILALPLLPAAQQIQLLKEFNPDLHDQRATETVEQLFIRQVVAAPQQQALIDAQGCLTYAQVYQAAMAVTQKLRAESVCPEQLICVRIPKGRYQLIATLAVMMAGAAYLPLEVYWPTQRCQHIYQKSGSRLVLVCRPEDQLPSAEINQLDISDLIQQALLQLSDVVPDAVSYQPLQRPENLAYVIFTSGSTGEPKGVEIEHHAVVNTLLDMNQRFAITANDKVLAVSALSFDLSVYDLFGLLAAGGTVVFPEPAMASDPAHWLALIEQHQISLWNSVPASASMLAEQLELLGRNCTSALRHIWMSGDWIAPTLPRRLWQVFPNSQVHSLGGATEGSIWSIHYPIVTDPAHLKSVPYGKPMSGQAFYILNAVGQLVPPGVSGELYIGGLGVARGYCCDQQQTSARFIQHHRLGRLYKTGDIGRYLADGLIEFIGRVDHQVKLRGFRIELGEIEARLNQLAWVEEAIVLVVGHAEHRQLAAFIVAIASQHDINSQNINSAVKTALAGELPDYMIPTAVVMLKQLPLTANGKVDQKALLSLDVTAASQRCYVAPRDPMQQQLCQLWQKLLQVGQVGIQDNFFELGGHSLIAIRLISAVRQTWQVELPLRLIFEQPTIEALASFIMQAHRRIAIDLKVMDRPEQLPLSYAQRRLWFLDRYSQGSSEYNMPGGFTIRGQLDEQALYLALDALLERHEALRTGFYEEGGQPWQLIRAQVALPLEQFDLRHDDETSQQQRIMSLLDQESRHVFDLQHELLIRFKLIRCAEQCSVLLFNMHHVISDGWSMGILLREFGALYQHFAGDQIQPLAPLPVQYADFALWQTHWLSGAQVNDSVQFWRKQLQFMPQLHNLPLDKVRPAQRRFCGKAWQQRLEVGLTGQIQAQCLKHNVSLFMYLQSVFAILIGRYSNQTDVVIGTAVSGREHQDLESLIGFFVNSVVLRSDLNGDPAFTDFLQQNKKMILDAFTHQDLPFDLLVEELNPARTNSHNPLFQIMFVLQNNDLGSIELPALKLEPVKRQHLDSKFDLHLMIEETNGALSLYWAFDTDLFTEQTIIRLAESYQLLLAQLTANDTAGIESVALVAAQDLPTLLAAAPVAGSELVFRQFERQAALQPDKTALVFGDASLTYQQLNLSANKLARYLLQQGVKPHMLVGLSVERSLEMVIAILAILKTGAAYLPLDPAYPESRLQYMIEDSSVRYVVTQSHIVLALPTAVSRLDLDQPQLQQMVFSSDNLPLADSVDDQSLAYVIYTSGSTGAPKGVMVGHGNVSRLFSSSDELFGFNQTDCWTLFHSYAFDFSVWELWGALLYGGRLVIVPADVVGSAAAFADLLCKEAVTVLNQTPSAFYPLIAPLCNHSQPHQLRFVCFGGEALAFNKLSAWFDASHSAHTRLINMYGITETTVHVTYHQVVAEANSKSIIGRPLPDLTAVVCNARQQCQPVNVEGELWVAGAGVSQGYLGRPELTASRFVTHSFAGEASRCWYRTGDLVRQLPSGELEYIGRIDAQVKVRGYRIETGEVEHVIQQSSEVEEALVLAQTSSAGDTALVAYLRPAQHLLDHYDGVHDDHGVAAWQDVFDSTYAKAGQSDAEPETDITGWQCSYRDMQIPLVEMKEWVDQTVDRIQQLKPSRVLEIGVGTGMLLFRYAAQCEHVTAIDISATVLQQVQHGISKLGWQHVTLQQADATALQAFHGGNYDTIILNSVAQYFPSYNYFRQVLLNMLQCLAPGGNILLGDIRNLDLLDAFSASIEICKADDEVSTEQLYQRAASAIQHEEELLFSPAYFSALLQQDLSIGQVDILLKPGLSLNEMMRYRYDVILRKTPVQASRVVQWYRWQDLAAFEQLLAQQQLPYFGVTGMTNPRIHADIRAFDSLLSHQNCQIQALKAAVGQTRCDQLQQLEKLAQDYGYQLQFTWDQTNKSRLDLILTRSDLTALPMIQPCQSAEHRNFVNAPQLRAVARQLIPAIRQQLELQLPAFMVPSAFMLLEKFPLTGNGKIDKKALPKWVAIRQDDYVAPVSTTEIAIQQIWQKVLNQPELSITANFFSLGGHSLLVTRLNNEISQQLSIELKVRDIFERPTIQALAAYIDELTAMRVLSNRTLVTSDERLEELEW
ncbi:hypothetical protein A5320_03915 [Rheinheimera sp. SA_1]|uniref:non-ribosomal peptide synthetase n=1 Tax=Rheinheimera sp. SA_1 TaxID=1827365 RepID=UPI0007FC1AB1|nr:non-ribosomal peptide synthetase [Rheinheimera sp. SA_1]OBP16552.1 hypothetical protein A5320_03915 [Rheinheimera sp. SA_1]